MMDTILFDLDGSLLPMDQDAFVNAYFEHLALKLSHYGHSPEKLIKGVLYGTGAMISNDGSMTNEARFWIAFEEKMGKGIRAQEGHFEDFYSNEFNRVKELTWPSPYASKCVETAKDKGYRVVLATNPIFPRVGTYARMGWAGLEPSDFSLVTTYEAFCSCKPNLAYYREVLAKTGKEAADCLMVGNDVKEDMCAAEIGMDVFLLTDCLINKGGLDISAYKGGSLEELLQFIEALPPL